MVSRYSLQSAGNFGIAALLREHILCVQNLRIRSLCERLPGTQNCRTRLLGAQIQILCDGEDQDASSAELDFVFQRFGKIGGIRIPVNQGVREQVINGPRGEGEAVGNERDDTS